MDHDEIDGVWNWIYMGYNHETNKAYAVYKGGHSDLKFKIISDIAHNNPLE